jgi:PST family polysaccharide transporter
VANSILLPLLAGIATQNFELRKVLSPLFRQSLVWIGLGMLLLFISYPFLLPLLFSSQFVAEREWIAWQVGGDFFKSGTYVFSILILALGHTRFYFWIEFASIFILLSLSFLLYHQIGFVALFVVHPIRYGFYWLVIVLKYRKILI